VIAGIGTGDRLSAAENHAYGVAFDDADTRRASLRDLVRAVLDLGLVAWVGDGAEATRRIAVEEGAALNVWDAAPSRVTAEAALGEVTWAGPTPPVTGGLAATAASVAAAGASWAVFAWPVDLDELAAAGSGGS
jgi:hypothetical protein